MMKRLIQFMMLVLLVGVALGADVPGGAPSFVAAVQRDTAWLAGYPTRVPGTAGHDAASAALLERLRALPNVRVWTQEFPVVVPVVTRAELVVTDGPLRGSHPVYPLWPDLVRLNSTPAAGLGGELVYGGAGTPAELSPRRLRGQIAVLEMADSANWKRPFALGATALLLLGSDADQAVPPAQQPLYMPRYYVPAGALCEALRHGEIARATVHCEASWQTVTARNLYALVRPAPTSGPPTEAPPPPLALAAAYDSMSVVMGLAPGADNAVDAALLLNELQRLAANPPPRAVLGCFIDAYGFNQLGARQMFAMLAITPTDKTRQDYHKLDHLRLQEYREAAAQVQALGEGQAALEQLWDKRHYRQLQRYFKDVVGPEMLKLKEATGALRLAIHTATDDTQRALQTELAVKQGRLTLLNDVTQVVLAQAPVTDALLPEGLRAWGEVRARVTGQLAALEAQMHYFENLDHLRQEIGRELNGATAGAAPLGFVVGLDLSDAGTAVGPGLYCGHLITNESNSARDFLRWLRQVVKAPADPLWSTPAAALATLTGAGPAALPASRPLRPELPDTPVSRLFGQTLSLESLAGNEDTRAFVVGPVSALTAPATSFALSGVTWMTLDGQRRRVDTPQDRAERLDWSRLTPQITTTVLLLERLLADAEFAPVVKPETAARPRWRVPTGSVVAESMSETVPRTPAPGLVTTLLGGSSTWPGPDGAVGVRRHEFVLTGPDGRFWFPPLPGSAEPAVTEMHVAAYGLAADGRIVRGVADQASMIAGRLSATVNLSENPGATPARVVVFDCQEVNGPEFFDPRFLEPLSQYALLDVERGGTPKRYQFSLHHGQMFGLLTPGTRWQLILRSGSAGACRMALLNVRPDLLENDLSLRDALQVGYPPEAALPSVPAHLAARDFYLVDSWRLDRFRRAGISSRPVTDIHSETGRLLAEADTALAGERADVLQRGADAALASEIRAYEALLATGDDVTRGAIFLMLLLVPFAIAMERLLFACARIGRQIVVSTTVFALMTAVLWSFHPAFRITAQPLIIVMAFAVLLLSLLVIIMIMRKFEADLELIRSGRAEASGAQTGRGRILGSAVLLGIATMRRRKLRTALTGGTIGLITFALLCFSSSTRYQEKREFAVRGAPGQHPQVLLRDPQMRALSPRALGTVDSLLAGTGCRTAPRYWWTSIAPNWRLHVRQPQTGRQLSLKAGLGLTPTEPDVSGITRFLPDWPQFARGDGCYLSVRMADELQVRAGDTVLVAGRELKLTGTFDARALEQELKMLDGQSLLPYDYTVQTEAQYRDPRSLEAEFASGGGLDADPGASHVAADDVIILPAPFVQQVGGTLRNIGVRTGAGGDARNTALGLMKVLAFPMYYGAGEEVKVVVATPLLPRPPRKLLIPLLIASLIIFNTMLSSVTERKREIHIYTSLGLAPRHVGMLFLAEAVTYGLMGSIFGYVIGQGLATVFSNLGWMGGITLNYSGSNVALTMGLVLAVTVLSALVPALMASRLATPGEHMQWHVPAPQGGIIRDVLPFTVTQKAARGLFAYIYDYLEAHREGSIGIFTTAELCLLNPGEGTIATVSASIWLAPYDLGVRQHVDIEVLPDVDDICSIHVMLVQASGEEDAWHHLNKAFLGDIRKQFLGWHKLKPGRVVQYIRDADQLFCDRQCTLRRKPDR